MKNSKLSQVLMFAAGLLIGGGIILGAFNKRIFIPESSAPGDSIFTVSFPTIYSNVNAISLDVAREHLKSYLSKGVIHSDPFRSFLVNRDELWAMNRLLDQKPELNGFRVFMGILGDPEETAIIVGVDNAGMPDRSQIYETSRVGSGPCPVICGTPDTTASGDL